MSITSPKSIASLLGTEPDSLIERLTAQQSRNDTLFHSLKANLDVRLSQHLVGASYRDDHLILVCDSPAWTNLLRYQVNKLLKRISDKPMEFGLQEKHSIKKIIVRTAVDIQS